MSTIAWDMDNNRPADIYTPPECVIQVEKKSDAVIIDDLQKELFRMKREMRSALNLLEVLPHAVSNGRTAVVNEYLERVTGHVTKAVKA
jgi:hypothetical protein